MLSLARGDNERRECMYHDCHKVGLSLSFLGITSFSLAILCIMASRASLCLSSKLPQFKPTCLSGGLWEDLFNHVSPSPKGDILLYPEFFFFLFPLFLIQSCQGQNLLSKWTVPSYKCSKLMKCFLFSVVCNFHNKIK